MYWAVATFGPDWVLTTPRVIFNSELRLKGTDHIFTLSPKFVTGIEVKPPVDLEDPKILAAALSKAQSVARSLKTSNGKILDVSIGGEVVASLDSIENSSISYRSAFAAKAVLADPGKLGILSQWRPTILEKLEPWEHNKIPAVNNALILNLKNAHAIKEGKHFTLDAVGSSLLQESVTAELFKPDLF